MQNIKIILQYDGTEYEGWQIQAGGRSIQGELTRVVSLLEDREVTVHGSGRTDSGVHAEGQVANFMIAREWEPCRLRDAINGNLPRDIRVASVEFVENSFHARRSARRKTYRYRVCTADVVSPFIFRYVYHHRGVLDLASIVAASNYLVGKHDFSAFTASDSEADTRVRTIDAVRFDNDLENEADGFSMSVTADGFLRYMVRTIAGTLIDVGRGRLSPQGVAEVLSSGDRKRAGPTAPAAGLTLIRVDY